jgi:hypothetical protein
MNMNTLYKRRMNRANVEGKIQNVQPWYVQHHVLRDTYYMLFICVHLCCFSKLYLLHAIVCFFTLLCAFIRKAK